MKKRKHIIHSEQYLAELLRNEEAKKRYEKDFDKLLIAYRIVMLRKEVHMTQAALAKKLGTTQSAVARIEAGRQNITIGLLVKLAATFGKKLSIVFAD